MLNFLSTAVGATATYVGAIAQWRGQRLAAEELGRGIAEYETPRRRFDPWASEPRSLPSLLARRSKVEPRLRAPLQARNMASSSLSGCVRGMLRIAHVASAPITGFNSAPFGVSV